MKLTIMSINVRGLATAQSNEILLNELRRHKVDIALLQECQMRFDRPTPAEQYTIHQLKLDPPDFQPWDFAPGIIQFMMARVGILILNNNLEVKDGLYTWRMMRIIVSLPQSLTSDGRCEITIQNCYAPASEGEKRSFWQDDGLSLSDFDPLTSAQEKSIILMGDLNLYSSHMDVWPSPNNNQPLQGYWDRYLQPLMSKADMIDIFRYLFPVERVYSRATIVGTVVHGLTRIDHMLGSADLADLVSLSYLPPIISDHSSVLAVIKSATFRPDIREREWRLRPAWLSDAAFVEYIRLFLEEAMVEDLDKEIVDIRPCRGNISMAGWTSLKGRMRCAIEAFNTLPRSDGGGLGPRLKVAADDIHLIRKELESLEPSMSGYTDAFPLLAKRYADAHKAVWEDQKAKRRQDISNMQMAPTRTMIESTRIGKPRPTEIYGLIEPINAEITAGGPAEEFEIHHVILGEILDYVKRFYQKLSAYFEPDRAKIAQDFLLGYMPRDYPAFEDIVSQLAVPIVRSEIHAAVKRANKKSAPGKDGFPYGLYETFCDPLEDCLVSIYNSMSAGCPLPDNSPLLLIRLIFKLKNKSNDNTSRITNYRPVSLIDTDLRIMSLAAAGRLSKLAEVICPNTQAAFIPNRHLIDGVATVMLVIDAANEGLIVGDSVPILAMMDQAKAFDRCSRTWILKVLEHVRCPESLISFYRQFYDHPRSSYYVQGCLTPEVLSQCGVLQGDPSAGLLFNICIQPFLNALDGEELGISIEIAGSVLKFGSSTYADDLKIFLQSREQLDLFEELYEAYSDASNARLNITKSEYFFLGDTKSKHIWTDNIPLRQVCKDRYIDPARPEHLIETKSEDRECTILGCLVRPDGQASTKYLWTCVNKAFGLTMALGPEVSLFTIHGRVALLNSMVMSKVWHSSQLSPLPTNFCKVINSKSYRVVLNSKANFLAQDVLFTPRKLGGLGLIDATSMTCAMLGKWLARIMQPDPDPSSMLCKHSLSREYNRLSSLRSRSLPKVDGRLVNILLPNIAFSLHPLRDPQWFLGSNAPKNRYAITRSGNRVKPWWNRIFGVLKVLKLGISENWDQYAFCDALKLPWSYFFLNREDMQEATVIEQGIVHDVHKSHLITFQDILWWSSSGKEVRIPPDKVTNEMYTTSHLVRNNDLQRDTWNDSWKILRLHWRRILRTLPKALRSLLLSKRYRNAPETAHCYNNGGRHDYITTDYHESALSDLSSFPWNFLTLGKMPIRDYVVRSAREFASSKTMIMPNTMLEDEAYKLLSFDQKRNLWASTWSCLFSWNTRPPTHLEAYYYLLHGRYWKHTRVFSQSHTNIAPLEFDPDTEDIFAERETLPPISRTTTVFTAAQAEIETQHEESSIDNSETEQQPGDFHFHLECPACSSNTPDRAPHAFTTCPAALAFWDRIIGVLKRLVGMPDLVVQITTMEIFFAFKSLRTQLAPIYYNRVLLWHSCAIFAISQGRREAPDRARGTNTTPCVQIIRYDEIFFSELRKFYAGNSRSDSDKFHKNYIQGGLDVLKI